MANMGWSQGWRGAVRHLLGDEGGWIQLVLLGLAAASAIAKNKAKNREAQNSASMVQDNQKNDQYNTFQNAMTNALMGQSNEQINLGNLDLRQRDFALTAPRERGRQALLGSLLQNMKPVSLSGLTPKLQGKVPNFSGGMTPEAIGPLAQQMGGVMQQNALDSQKKGDQFAPLQRTNFLGGIMPPPSLTQYRGPGKAESILGMLGAAGEVYGAYQGMGGGGQSFNNSMPANYTGLDMYGNPANWQLPRGTVGG